MNKSSTLRWQDLLSISVYGNAGIVALLGLYFFVLPFFLLLHDLSDPALRTGDMPHFAYRWHKALSAQYEPWARERVTAGSAAGVAQYDISGTEWPIFGSVYYLWATEALQEAWEQDRSLSREAPAVYARGAIEAAADLVADPNHAAWVKAYWGEDYLYTENIFYRMLYISGLTSYQKLSGNDRYQEALRLQVDSLAAELDASPYGLLDDYPGQCYPIDILPAIAAIQRADKVLGTDHSAMLARAVRAFKETRLDPSTGLPAYVAEPSSGHGIGPSRGVGISYMLIWAPELWPDTAQNWYVRYNDLYWQQDYWVAGVREFSRESSYPDWFFADVDAGPVLAGYGTAASSFGIGAARTNGHLDQAHSLSAEALVVSWPLADGTLLTPRLLSNLSDAPYLGESALLFTLTRKPVLAPVVPSQGRLPLAVHAGVAAYALLGAGSLGWAFRSIKREQANRLKGESFPAPEAQFLAWSGLILTGVAAFLFQYPGLGVLALILAQLLPRDYEKSF